jgi:hypothetical protein
MKQPDTMLAAENHSDPAGSMILDFPVFKTMRKEIFVHYKLPSLKYFVILAQAD